MRLRLGGDQQLPGLPGLSYVKLDTGVIGSFDAALGARVETIRTGTFSVLAALARQAGAGAALRSVIRAVLGAPARSGHLVEGNVWRKAMRLPWLFGRGPLKAAYAWVKAFEASILSDYLRARFGAESSPPRAIVFNGSNYPESVLAEVFSAPGRARLFVEAGFFPGTLQIDPMGLNAANSVPRDPAFYLSGEADFTRGGLPKHLNARSAKIPRDAFSDLPKDYVFVPFQVPSDMQVRLHSPWIPDMESFLDILLAAADRNPKDVFVVKEHPSFKRSVAHLRPRHPRVIFAGGNPTADLIAGARAVMTINSTVGIEALVIDKPVIVLGEACYAIDGLVLRAADEGQLDRALRDAADWRPDPTLRAQYLGYLWNEYLVRARYDDLPNDFAAILDAR